jgi:tRNA threonylcarbamoyladenosine biosynthesis protein TsaE
MAGPPTPTLDSHHLPSDTLTRSEGETRALARAWSANLAAGDVLLVSGDLGAGKTAFVRGLAEGLGVGGDEVSSPTFALVHEYRGGRLALFHADLYRLEGAAAEDLGLEELGADDGVLAIEWPERLSHGFPRALVVDIQIVDDTTRRVVLSRRDGK